jgi:hypothetical protein
MFTGDHFCRRGQLSSRKKGLFFAFSMAQSFQTMRVPWYQGRSASALIPGHSHGTLHAAIERSIIRESIMRRSRQE